MTTKWTIWHIKNRWLRVAVAWPVIGAVVAAFAVVGTIMIPVAAAIGAWERMKEYFLSVYQVHLEFRADGTYSSAWAALSGKDEPA